MLSACSDGRGESHKQLVEVVVSLLINASKTKFLSAHVDPLLRQVINVAGDPLEKVSSFKYLGTPFTASGQDFKSKKIFSIFGRYPDVYFPQVFDHSLVQRSRWSRVQRVLEWSTTFSSGHLCSVRSVSCALVLSTS